MSAFEIVAVPWDYNISFSLTDFPLVCPLSLHAHAVNVFVPPSLGLFMSQFFSHMHLCLLFTLHNCRQSGFLSRTKGANVICLHPFQGLIEAAQCTWMHGQHALRLMHIEGMLHQPCLHWSVIAFEDYVLGSKQISLRYFRICLDHPCLLIAMPIWHHVPTLAEHVQVPAASMTLRVQPCSLGSITSGNNTICTVCGNSTFSLDPSSTVCDACPSGAQCNGSDAFIPPAQYYHSSPNSTHIVSCPNPGACGGDRTTLLDCKLVSADYSTTQPASHVWPLKLCLLPCTGGMPCDTRDAHAIHPLYYTRSNVHRSHALYHMLTSQLVLACTCWSTCRG